MRTRLGWLPLLAVVAAGCASAPAPLPVGTLVLAQVAHVATREEMAIGVRVDGTPLRVPPYLVERCALDPASLDSGALAVTRVFVFWVSRVPQSSHWWVAVPKEVAVAPGDFVEVELKSGVGDQRCPVIARVRSPASTGRDCGFARNERSGAGAMLGGLTGALHALGGTGGGAPGSSSIYCKGLEEEGWARHQAGPYDAVVWRKAPAGR